jgi:tetratricopeptide (TPR) repeat protein
VTWSIFEAVTLAEGIRLRDTPIDELDAWGLFALARDTPLVNAAARDHVLKLLRRGVEHDPEFGPAHAWLAFQLAVVVNTQFSRRPEEDQRDAITHADRALALMPNNPGIMSMAGYPHRLFGSETLAIELSERTHKMAGRGSWFTFSTFIQAGRSAEVLDMAANTSLAGAEYGCVAHAELLNGGRANALDCTQKWVGAESGNYLAWIALANVLAMLDRAPEAHEAWDRAKKMVPTLTLALFEKGTRGSWRDREAIAGPLYEGLRTLGLE